MKKVLFAPAKVDSGPRSAAALDTLRGTVSGDGIQIVAADELPWDSILRSERSWSRAYRWASTQYDALVLLETEAGGIGRGQYSLWQAFEALGKPSSLIRSGSLSRIRSCARAPEEDWKECYARVEIVE